MSCSILSSTFTSLQIMVTNDYWLADMNTLKTKVVTLEILDIYPDPGGFPRGVNLTCDSRVSDKRSFLYPCFFFFPPYYLAAPSRLQQALHLGSHLLPTNLTRCPVTSTARPPRPLLSTVRLAREIPRVAPAARTVTPLGFTSLYYMLAMSSAFNTS